MPIVSVTVPAEVLKAVDRFAFRQHRTRSNMVALILEEALKGEIEAMRLEEDQRNGQRTIPVDTLADDPK